VARVCRCLREVAHSTGVRVIYGGSAGPGPYAEIADAVDGLFLGRFAHDPGALESVLAEVRSVRSTDRKDPP
jgi:triosephosphate isomerase